MADPYAGVTAEVDITRFLMACRGAETPFFLSFLYCAGRAANAVPELRQRILDGRPVEGGVPLKGLAGKHRLEVTI